MSLRFEHEGFAQRVLFASGEAGAKVPQEVPRLPNTMWTRY